VLPPVGLDEHHNLKQGEISAGSAPEFDLYFAADDPDRRY